MIHKPTFKYMFMSHYATEVCKCPLQDLLPEGSDLTLEGYKREVIKLRIENERLKKSYAVQTNADGEREYVRLKQKSLK